MLKRILVVASVLLSVTANADVKNLDKIPESKKELERLIRHRTIEIEYLRQNVFNYTDLVLEARNTRKNARTVAKAGVTAGIGGAFAVLSAPMALIGTTAFGVVLIPNHNGYETMDDIEVVKYLESGSTTYTSAFKYNYLTMRFGFNGYEYKYGEVHDRTDRYFQEINQQYFDGSFFNMIMDHVSLGTVSETGFIELYMNRKFKLILLEQELKDLIQLRSVIVGQ